RVAAGTLPDPAARGVTAVGARVVDGGLGHLAILGAGPDVGSVDSVSIRERVFAALYDPMSATAERKFGAESKRKQLANAPGRVRGTAAGTGLSSPHYRPDLGRVGVEPPLPMLRRAQRRAAELGRDVTLVEAAAEKLPFEDGSFDTTVSLAVLCSVDDPARVLDEL